MGLLESDRGDRHRVWADHLIGRSPDATLCIDDASISWRHASLRWTGRVWELQDLGSLNGTFLDGRRIESGGRAHLRVGSALRFGQSSQAWEFVDDDPPWPSAVALDTGERIPMQDGMIGLPDPSVPEVSIYRDPDGRWLAESSDDVWEPNGDEIVEAASRRFRFERGAIIYATSAASGKMLTPATVRLEFEVSRNEEHVAIAIVHDAQRTVLRPRAHGYMLLTLARLRLEEQSEPKLPPPAHGWVEQARLLKMLATTPSQLALDIHRARRQLADAGVEDAAHLIERRPDSRELRIGVSELSIVVA